MLTSALIFFAIAISSVMFGSYAHSDQGLDEIMDWCAIVSLAFAGGFLLLFLARHDAG